MSRAWRAPLIAIAASLGLIGVYLAFGGATYDPADVADPCQQRDQALLEERSVFETIALSGLDGAACDLGVPREELALALTSPEATEEFAAKHDVDSADVENAVRAGMVRAVDDAAAAGRIDGFEETVLRQVAEHAPVGPAIDALQALSGDDSVQGLLEQLGGLQDLSGSGGLPSLDDIRGLLGG